ncbi:pyridoxal phosphate-dependent transferase, partial [Mycena galericulata]
GAFGVTPQVVLNRCRALDAEVESNPDLFVRMILPTRIDEVRGRIAAYLGISRAETVLVPNVGAGLNTVLQNIAWKEGDVLVMLDTTFPAVAETAKHLLGPKIEHLELRFPASHAEIVQLFQSRLRDVRTRVGEEATVVALFDSIVSFPGVLLPWKEMVKICREESVISVVDAAHSLGQERACDIDLAGVQPDFWISSCSKWFFAQRGVAVLYVPRRNQQLVKENVPCSMRYPPSQDEEYADFAPMFYWNGSYDISSRLSVSFALDFRSDLGSDEELIRYCHDLAVAGGKETASILGTQVMVSPEDPEELIAAMVNIELSLQTEPEANAEMWVLLQKKMLAEHKVFATPFFHNNRWWIRASAQVFNQVGVLRLFERFPTQSAQIEDFTKLGIALAAICDELSGGGRGSSA